MKIGMITQWYEPESGSAAHPTAIARALRDRGHEVKVLTGFPSYPRGRVFDGYQMKLRAKEQRDGISMLRVPDIPSHDRSAIRRGLSLTSFAASATAQVGWLRDVDVCLVYLTPATVGAAAMTLRRLWGIPYVVYVQDLWPETVTASGFIQNEKINQLAESGLHRWLRQLYAGADGIAGISPTMAKTLGDRGATTPPVSIPNWIDEQVFYPPDRPSTRLPRGRTWIMYAGGIGEVQGLETALEALTLLPDRADVGLALVGDGVAVPALMRQAEALGIDDRVRFLGSFPMREMPALMAESAAQLVSLRDLPLFRGTIPSKLQASLAVGCPIVCSVSGDAASLVQSAGVGFVAIPEDASSLAEAFLKVANLRAHERTELGNRARRFYLEHLGAESGATALESLLLDAGRDRAR